MSEVGTVLRKKRDEMGLSLSEVSLHTKISPKVLTAIESGNKQALPALPFARGFIRSYAQYLKLDGDKILADFLHEIGDASEISEAHTKVENAVSNAVDVTDDEGVGTRVLLIGGVILLIGLIVGLKSLIDKYQREAQVVEQVEVTSAPIVEDKEEKAPPPPVVGVDDVKVDEKPALETKPESTLVVGPMAPLPPKEPAKEEIKKPEPIKVESAKEEPVKIDAPKVEATKIEPVKTEPAKVETAKPDVSAAGASQEVILEALDNTTVSVNIGKGATKQIKLQAGQIHVLRAKAPIHLNLSDSGAVNITHNGRSKGVPGTLGQAKKVSYP